jgi:hypothetical protein
VTATISAIMPLYNGREHCAAALRSVLAQTRLPDEVIVIDDGSSDGSLDVVRNVVSPLPVKLLEQPNRGQSAARNEAARVATGDLLAFIDQDDLWHPEHLAVLAAPFEDQPDLGWTYSDFDEIDGASRTVTHRYLAEHGVDVERRTLASFLGSDLMMLPSAAVIRASAFEAVGGFDEDLCGYEDDDLFVRLFRAGWRYRFEERSLTSFRVHGELPRQPPPLLRQAHGGGARRRPHEPLLRARRRDAAPLPDDPGRVLRRARGGRPGHGEARGGRGCRARPPPARRLAAPRAPAPAAPPGGDAPAAARTRRAAPVAAPGHQPRPARPPPLIAGREAAARERNRPGRAAAAVLPGPATYPPWDSNPEPAD